MAGTTFYELRRRDGTVVAIHKRIDGPDGKTFSWLLPDGRSGLNGTAQADLPLYGAHLLNTWPETAPIVVVEGEKAADALTGVGIPAVGTVGAGVTPGPAVLADLAGRSILLWPDNDDPGRKLGRTIAQLLSDTAAVGWVEWPEAPAKGDAADFLAGGRTAGDVRALLATATDPHLVEYRTLADLDDKAPGELLFGMLEDGPNLLVGSPGVGKGMTATWIVCEALKAGMRPMVYDAERRPREWRRRVAGLGGDCSRVVYLDPTDLGEAAGQPFWKAIEPIARIRKAAGADLLLVDSLLTATGIAEDKLRSDARAPFDFVRALDSLAIVTVSLGHPPKGSPEGEAYGSMAWTAAMRLTWSGTRAEGDGHRVRWRARKRNERGRIPGLLLTFGYDADGRLSSVTNSDDDVDMRTRLLALLADREWHTVAELVEEMLLDDDEVSATRRESLTETVGRRLRQLYRDGALDREGKGGRVAARWRKAA